MNSKILSSAIKERISIEFLNDDVEAYIIFNMTKEELDMRNRESLVIETSTKLRELGICFGIAKGLFLSELESGKRYLIAKGIAPINGNDCIINMYKLKDSKAELQQDGSVDYYELKLINRVKTGDWLGEKLDATKGIPGKSVKGQPIKASDGKNYPLNYDRSTVMEIWENNKSTLYSRINGAVSYSEERIMVSNHLEIEGDVDFKTGNIKFDGYVTINGTVAAGFHVEATRDIEINGQFGIGHIKGLISTHGSIYIRGGISSKGRVSIKAAKNIFTKFVDNATISCGGTLHIGYYCLNSVVNAKEVILESLNGQIIGGTVTAEIRVIAPIIGSDAEKKTIIEVTGFNRSSLLAELDATFHEIGSLKAEQQRLKQNLAHYDALGHINPFQKKDYEESFERMLSMKDTIKELEEKRKNIASYIKTRGEGEINITKKAFPNCTLCIKKSMVEINSATSAISYFSQDGELKHT